MIEKGKEQHEADPALESLEASLTYYLLDRSPKIFLSFKDGEKTKIIMKDVYDPKVGKRTPYIPVFVAKAEKILACDLVTGLKNPVTLIKAPDLLQEYALLSLLAESTKKQLGVETDDLKIVVNPTITDANRLTYVTVTNHLKRLRELVRAEGKEIGVNWKEGGEFPAGF